MAANPLFVTSVILALGAISNLIADRYQIPNIVFLLAFGVLIGSEGLGFINASLSTGGISEDLSLLVGIAVALIVFEGAFSLSLREIRNTPRPTLYLVTIGSAITFIGLGLVIHVLLGIQWILSFLISALLIATGPTVITPIMEQITVPEKIASILETEGIINDPVASVLGAVIYTVAVNSRLLAGQEVVTDFITRLSIGVFVGIVTALVLSFVLRKFSRTPADSRIVVLAAALLTYSIATLFADEAGVVSVAVAGLAMGNSDVPFQDEIAGFSGVVSSVVLSAVYIVLAALIQFDEILSLGLGGLAVVLLAMLVVRPLSVFVSTVNSEYSWNGRLFISAIGPRGIIPAATATLFSIQLSAAGVANATTVVSLVFLVILVTVVVEAGGAPLIGKKLDIVAMTTIIIGGSVIGRELADEINERDGNPVIIERDEQTVSALREEEYSVVHGEGTDDDVLRKAGGDGAEMVIATTGDDATNILACQTARTKFGIKNLVSLVNDPAKTDSFEDLGVSTIMPTQTTVTAIGELVSFPSLFKWRESTHHRQKFAEETVVSDTVEGKQIGDLDLPAQCAPVLVQRNGDFIIATPDVTLQQGDIVTILGQSDTVKDAVSLLTDDD